MIEINRVARFLHKFKFKKRQRYAYADHAQRYVITEKDVAKRTIAAKKGADFSAGKTDPKKRVKTILDGFDPVNDDFD